MRTEELIAEIAADAGRHRRSPDVVLAAAFGLSVLAAVAVFSLMFGSVRADLAGALETPRFLVKLGAMVALAGAGLLLVRALSTPGAAVGRAALALALPAVILAAGALFEVATVPAGHLYANLVGNGPWVCLISVPILAAAPLVIALAALRQSGPTRPGLAGAAAGLLSGALAATVYATWCNDDSPLFVIAWYLPAIVGVSAAGWALGRTWLRW